MGHFSSSLRYRPSRGGFILQNFTAFQHELIVRFLSRGKDNFLQYLTRFGHFSINLFQEDSKVLCKRRQGMILTLDKPVMAFKFRKVAWQDDKLAEL